ncbi:MAG: HlyD family efflux transporter periplasmic adaptor subunit [Bacteroidia bacterium]|nr:HlyD family efflux transporter periplasmic adaptor subunit [Bacteroidia bacterium]MBT8270358.1 HlyD family efflux transporter periplasmic adaptor subunit [Bacteroidia bacterium]NNF83294.1 HlyD family efflux transporter periplasmic adaptor subunit [Flavobacteriaceae bacterium]NNK71216.1 HlyD family efflux transporter periplasmic adaptor subunit [Flavobacteriaceae bacterium]NNL79805.1 HlyD family efflux transporter periplasmic adaptor subunit [Flavobacteriaceae bacterium]
MVRALVLFFSIILLHSCQKGNDGITVEKTDLVESVYTSLTVQPDSLYDAYSVVSGIIDEVLVEEGDTVNIGQPLIQIINNAPKLNTENARLSLKLARENYSGGAAILAGIEDEIIAATLRYKNDSINFFRQKNLWDQNIGSRTEYDTKELQYQLSSNNLRLLESRYERTKNELQTTLQQAENSYQSSLINIRDFTVKSMISGKVYAIQKEKGELVTSLQSLAKLGSASEFILELLVDEVDIVKVSIDQKVLITLDAYKGQLFEGKISRILPNKDVRNQTFMVEALFDNPPDPLYPGLSGEANIITSTRSDVLAIPKEYLTDGNQVNTDEGLVEVVTGVDNLDLVEIVSGISEGTVIYKPDQ